PLNKFRNLLHLECVPVYHIKGWGKFKRHYGDFCIGADRATGNGCKGMVFASLAKLVYVVQCESTAVHRPVDCSTRVLA
ncbi:MAG: hypothetical protein WB781_14785, partial [Candidatus Sulfotelmatobacter sp.]